MSTRTSHSLEVPYLSHDMVNDRIQTLHREAEEQRLISRLQRVERARRQVRRANDRLRRALSQQA
ncbi:MULTISPECIES: hypothetical protein [unclassified Nonomuraea]|uniref:hypothetical protein n=1 Tax=unclassified Nonomuraea TaxID=2593643 RepID=UPI0033FEE2F1